MITNDPALGFCSQPLPTGDGYTWTLTTLLGNFLADLEDRFGPRDRTFTPLGIEFCGETPQIWYPGNRGHISIMLTDSARLDIGRAVFQLAHEAVHLLAPTGARAAPVVEEGLATLFADEMSARLKLSYRTHLDRYVNASSLVQTWLRMDPNGIREFRAIEPCFARWSAEELQRARPQLPMNLAVGLCAPFA